MISNYPKLGKVVTSLVFLFLFTISVAFAYEECSAKQPVDETPCLILLQSSEVCTSISVMFYNISSYLSTTTMQQYSPFVCSANFTFNQVGTYNFNYTTGDAGAIVLEEGNKMIYLIYLGIGVTIALMVLGLKIQNQPIIAIDGILFLTLGFWLFKNGFSIYQNLITDALGLIGIMIGGYFLIMATLSMIDEGF